MRLFDRLQGLVAPLPAGSFIGLPGEVMASWRADGRSPAPAAAPVKVDPGYTQHQNAFAAANDRQPATAFADGGVFG